MNLKSPEKLMAGMGLIAALGALFYFYDAAALLGRWLGAIEAMGPRGMAVFVFVYALSALLFVPGSFLTLGAGAIYGFWSGFALVSLASTLGSAVAFLIGRTLARDWVASKLNGNERFSRLDDALSRAGWKIVALARLSPVLPYNLLNYAFGLARITFGQYVVASWLGMMPGTLMYVYFGTLAGSVANLGAAHRKTPFEWALYGLGLLATIALSVYVTRLAQRALDDSLAPSKGAV